MDKGEHEVEENQGDALWEPDKAVFKEGAASLAAAETMSKNAERTDQRSGQHSGVKWPH